MHFKMKSREGALFRSIKKKAQPCCRHVTVGLLVALSGHATSADECPLLGAKRTLTDRCLPISIYEYANGVKQTPGSGGPFCSFPPALIRLGNPDDKGFGET